MEFALIFPIFIFLLFGLFDVGRAVFAYNTLSNAAREAARVAIVNQTETAIDAQAMQRTVGMDVAADDVDVSYTQPGTTTPCTSPYGINCVASVSVEYEFTPATPIIGNFLGSITLRASTKMPVERTCPEPPNLNSCT